MKKKLFTLFVTSLLLVLTACGNDEVPKDVNYDETALQQDAVQVADNLRNGEYSTVVKKFDKQMLRLLNEEALKTSWEQAMAELGAYSSRVSTTGAVQDGYYVVEIIESFEKNGLLVRVVYDADGKIAGLYFTLSEVAAQGQNDSYTETEITVAGDPELPLGGTLTLPAGVEKPPVVILLHGSGPSDRDETINGNKPFADIAHGLAEQGIASIRYDKRYYKYPESGTALGASLTLDDEVLEDAYAAIALAQSDERVDGSRVYLLGHSLGGMLLPAIASETPELSGIISMAGTLRPLWEVSYDQNQEAIATLDLSALSEDDKKTLDAQIAQIEIDIAVLRGDFSAQADETMLMGIPVGYWKSLKQYDGANLIKNISMPMLILQGDSDFHVSSEKDYTLWQTTLAGRDNVTFRLYEGLNHLMMPTQGKRDVTEYQATGSVDSQVISDIAAFIKGE